MAPDLNEVLEFTQKMRKKTQKPSGYYCGSIKYWIEPSHEIRL